MPPIAWSPVLLGSALSIAITLVGAPLIGALAGGALAGLRSAVAPAYQGSLVGMITILALAVLPVTGPDDTAVILLLDAALLAVGALSALVAGRLRR
ncbi:MAG: hypothetical protein M3Q61_05170 [Chloroflexota bacterium]|nr:hypothetical protein [Chloroflexota bacterium]